MTENDIIVNGDYVFVEFQLYSPSKTVTNYQLWSTYHVIFIFAFWLFFYVFLHICIFFIGRSRRIVVLWIFWFCFNFSVFFFNSDFLLFCFPFLSFSSFSVLSYFSLFFRFLMISTVLLVSWSMFATKYEVLYWWIIEISQPQNILSYPTTT